MPRLPAVAGQFYERSPDRLRDQVMSYMDTSAPRQSAVAVIAPHAGLMYSGPVAGAVYSHVRVPESVILIGPNHSGQGPRISVFPQGTWQIPGAEFPVDQELVNTLLARIPQAEADESAHQFEHCLEVQLPFLWQARSNLRIVPIVLSSLSQELCQELGQGIAEIIRERSQGTSATPPLIVATTDMNHYEPERPTREKDALAIEAIQQVNPDSLRETVRANRISMCGLGPTLTTLLAVNALVIPRATLIRYATSGEVSGDLERVVGYAGFIFSDATSSDEIF